MATGTGTQSDPRIVYNWGELQDAFRNYYYIELGNDIYAPDESASLVGGIECARSIDGRGYRIINLFTLSGNAITISGHAGYVFQPIIRNVNFCNINCQGDNFLNYVNAYSVRIENVLFSGCVYGNALINIDFDSGGYFNYCGGTIHTNSNQFALIKIGYSSNVMMSCNSWGIDYGSVTPNSSYSLISGIDINNSLFQLRASQGGTMNIGNCRYCALMGSGDVKILGSSQPNVVLDTLTLDDSSTGTNYLVTENNIKNVQYLYDLGFPASGVIS